MYMVFGMRGRWDFGPSSELSWLPPTRAFQTAGCGIEGFRVQRLYCRSKSVNPRGIEV